MPQNFIISPQQHKNQVLICLTRVILKTKPILSVKVDEKGTCCFILGDPGADSGAEDEDENHDDVVCQLFTLCWLIDK